MTGDDHPIVPQDTSLPTPTSRPVDDHDPTTWTPKREAMAFYGVTEKTLERWVKQHGIRTACLPRPGGGRDVVVYHPGELADVAARSRRAAVAGILVVDGDLPTNGNGHQEVQALDRRPVEAPPRALALPPGEHVIRVVLVTESIATSPPMSLPMSPSARPDYEFLTVEEVAAELRLSVGRTRQRINAGKRAGTLQVERDRRGVKIRRRDLPQV